jgi:hypothetical protein
MDIMDMVKDIFSVLLLGAGGFIFGLSVTAIFARPSHYTEDVYGRGQPIYADFWHTLPYRLGLACVGLGVLLVVYQGVGKINQRHAAEQQFQAQRYAEDIRFGRRTQTGHLIECIGNFQYLVLPGRLAQREPYREVDGTHRACQQL